MALRVPGRGMPAEKPGLPPGDLFIAVRTADDPRFVRHGRDLYRVETVEAVDVVLGTSIDVPTLEGEVSVKVPPVLNQARCCACAKRDCRTLAAVHAAISMSGSRFMYRNGSPIAKGACSSS